MNRILYPILAILILAATVACLVRIATYAPARHAIAHWGFFGQSERILPRGHR